MQLRDKLIHAVTEYDRKQSKRAHYNIYALPQYLARVDEVCADIEAGAEPRKAIMAGFSDRLLTHVLKAADLPDFTASEMIGAPACYNPTANS